MKKEISWKFVKEFRQYQMFELYDGKFSYTISNTEQHKYIVHRVPRDIAEGIWSKIIMKQKGNKKNEEQNLQFLG